MTRNLGFYVFIYDPFYRKRLTSQCLKLTQFSEMKGVIIKYEMTKIITPIIA
jgi:hypothetical protein